MNGILRSGRGNDALDLEGLASQEGILKWPLPLTLNTSLQTVASQKCDTNQYGHILLAIILLNLSFPLCTDGFFSQRLLCIGSQYLIKITRT